MIRSLLVVDDDPDILSLMEDYATSCGYCMTKAVSGGAAAALLASDLPLCAVITDIQLRSGIDGWEIGRLARQSRGGIAVIYMTGTSAHEWLANGVPGSEVVAKPFKPGHLFARLETLLSRPFLSDLPASS